MFLDGGAAEALSKTKEQLAEEKAICLSIRIKPLNVDDISGKENLKRKADNLWEQIVTLETERYDLEERNKRQDYDVSNLIQHQSFARFGYCVKHEMPRDETLWWVTLFELFPIAERVEGATKATTPTESIEAWSQPWGTHRKIPCRKF